MESKKNHLKYGCIYTLLRVIISELPLNIEIIFASIVVSTDGNIGTVLCLYHSRHLEEKIHQLQVQIITLFLHLESPNTIKGLFSSARVLRKKRDKNGHLLGFVPHKYFFLFDPLANICTSFRNTLLYYSLCAKKT